MYITADLLEAGNCNVYSYQSESPVKEIQLRRMTNNPSVPFPLFTGRLFGIAEKDRFKELLFVRDSSA